MKLLGFPPVCKASELHSIKTFKVIVLRKSILAKPPPPHKLHGQVGISACIQLCPLLALDSLMFVECRLLERVLCNRKLFPHSEESEFWSGTGCGRTS